jgi:hypothetical protein
LPKPQGAIEEGTE